MPIRDDDPPEVRRKLMGTPAMIAEAAYRIAVKVEKELETVEQDLEITNHEVKLVSARVDNLEGRIIASLARIEHRLGIIEDKAEDPPTNPELQTGSLRPISYHDLPNAMAAVMPVVEAQARAKWWAGVGEGLRWVFSEGVKRGAAITVGTLVAATLLLTAGYFIRDCTHAIVQQGQSQTVPKLRPAE